MQTPIRRDDEALINNLSQKARGSSFGGCLSCYVLWGGVKMEMYNPRRDTRPVCPPG